MSKPKVLIMRGIPGSGKTTWVKNFIKTTCPDNHPAIYYALVYSADDFWIQPDHSYRFDPKRIGEAHTDCFKRFCKAVESYRITEGPDYIVVDNTNIRAYEIAPYIAVANLYGLEHEIVTIWTDPAVAMSRNVHDVPSQIILHMYQGLLSETLPSFWKHRLEMAGASEG